MKAHTLALALGISAAALGALAPAEAAEPVRLFAGGPSSVEMMAPFREALDKAAGTKVEINVQPNETAMKALVNGLIDGVFTGDPKEAFAKAEKAGLPKQDLNNYMIFETPPGEIALGVHPNNPAKAITPEQLKDILAGTTKTWEPITGEKKPLTVFVAKNYMNTTKLLFKKYLNQDTSSAVTFVSDKNGLLKAIQSDPNAIGVFTTSTASLADFKPKYLPTDIRRPAFIIMKKGRPEAEKAFNFIKAQKLDRD